MEVNIANILGINKLDYLNYRTDQFNLWCAMVAEGIFVPNRILQQDDALYNYYTAKWNKHIQFYFLPAVQEYIEADIKDGSLYQPLFLVEVVKPLQLNYPSAIINHLKKQHYDQLTSAHNNAHEDKNFEKKITKAEK